MTRRGRGRPPLTEGEAPVKRTVLLPPELDAAAERRKGAAPWATWLRGLVERAVYGESAGLDEERGAPPAARREAGGAGAVDTPPGAG